MISALKLLTPTCALVKSQVYPKWCFSSNLWYPRFGIPISGTSSQKILIKLLWVREFDHFFLQETTMITRFLLDRSYLATTIHGFNRRFSLQHSSTNPTFLRSQWTCPSTLSWGLTLTGPMASRCTSDICRAVVRWRSGTGSTWERAWNAGVSGTTT